MNANPLVQGIVAKPLHVFFLVDVSTSMSRDGRIGSLNNAMEMGLAHLRDWEVNYPNIQVFVRVISFADRAQWHVVEPSPVASFRWTPLTAGGTTAMGGALELAAEALGRLEGRQAKPLVVLITDGQPTDDFERGLARFEACPAADAVLRVAVAIGEGVNRAYLTRFVHGDAQSVLSAGSAHEIVEVIKIATMVLDDRRGQKPNVTQPPVPPGADRQTTKPPAPPTDLSQSSGDWIG